MAMNMPTGYMGSDLEFQNFMTDDFDVIGNQGYLDSLANPGGGVSLADGSFLGGTSGNFFQGASGLENLTSGLGMVSSLAGLLGGIQNNSLMRDALKGNIRTQREQLGIMQDQHRTQQTKEKANLANRGITL